MSRIAALSTSAPLMFTPESRMPEGGIGEWFRGAGGLRLRLGYWPAPRGERASRGTIFVSPGRSEPIEKYYEVIRDLLARDFDVVIHDWRGQGLSARLLPDRLKCHARSADEFLDDFQRLLDTFEDRAPRPWVMLGHSMGAALNLATLVKGEPRISGAFLVNPMLRVKTGNHSLWAVNFQVNWQVNHGRGSDYVPDLFEDPFENTFENDALTHDRARYERWHEQLFACPHLAVGSPTWGWLQFALRIGEKLLRDKDKALKKVKTPVTLLCSGDDHVVNRQPVRAFARKLGKAHYAEVAGAEHEILIEVDEYRDQAWQEFDVLMDFVAPRHGMTGDAALDAPDGEEAGFAAWPQAADTRLSAVAAPENPDMDMPLPEEVLPETTPETTPASGDQA